MKQGAGFIKSPALKVKAIDTTGAGDAFAGAFIYGMLKNWDNKKILKFANKVAGLKCREIGCRKGLPSYNQAIN